MRRGITLLLVVSLGVLGAAPQECSVSAEIGIVPRAWFPYVGRGIGQQKPGVSLATRLPGYDAVWFRAADGLLSDEVRTVAVDGRGATWFGTDVGVTTMWPDGVAVPYTATDGLGYNTVSDIAIDGKGDPWFGTYSDLYSGDWVGALSRFDGMRFETWLDTGTAGGGLFNVVVAVAVDSVGDVWLATYPWSRQFAARGPGGVFRLQHRGSGDTWQTWTEAAGVSLRQVDDVVTDRRGNTWLSTGDALVRVSSAGEWQHLTVAEGLPAGRIHSLSVDPVTDGLWVATDTAVAERMPGGTWHLRNVRPGDGLPSDGVGMLAPDRRGAIWFSSCEPDCVVRHNGVLWPDDSVTLFDGTDGPLNAWVHDITVDANDSVWLATAEGAVRLRPR
jgi:ligand-binding sensor domain-containing protein